MQIRDRIAVVTGGASGIGRSLCLAFADHGAAGVVVADVDAPGAEEVAAQVIARGSRALAVRADMTREGDVRALVGQAQDAFGRIDLFCSNAGIIVAGGVEVSDEAWTRIWAVNVQSHVYVARAVLPGMLARGAGYLVITASAAGLLTQLGSAPYAVTKHAAVALAEWLSITYGDQRHQGVLPVPAGSHHQPRRDQPARGGRAGPAAARRRRGTLEPMPGACPCRRRWTES